MDTQALNAIKFEIDNIAVSAKVSDEFEIKLSKTLVYMITRKQGDVGISN